MGNNECASEETVPVLKKRMRRLISEQRSALAAETRAQYSLTICEKAIIQLQPVFKAAGEKAVLFTYIPFGAEVDVLPIVAWCWQHGVKVVAPKTLQSGKHLQLHYISGFDDLKAVGPWGIYEPLETLPLIEAGTPITCILLPGIAFDLAKSRLGYGGGYYDRFLEKLALRGETSPIKLALAYDLQLVPLIPSEAHDYRVDCIITELRTIQ